VGYQSCDSSTAQAGFSDFLKCASNAKAYAATPRLVGVIGPFNSPCAWAQIPITNRAEGPLAMISPSNTHPGLTHAGPGIEKNEPGIYYPSGTRNYVRIPGPEDFEAAAGAVLAEELGLRRVYVLRSEGIGEITTIPFTRAARRLGVGIVGTSTWSPQATSYRGLTERIASARPDGVFIGDFDAGAVIKAVRARLGRKVVLIGGEYHLPPSDLLEAAGPAAVDMYVSTTAVAHEGLSPAGKRFLRGFAKTQPDGVVPSALYIPEAAQAAEALLEAIARSDGTRASVNRELRELEVKNGILGSFRFDRNGDIDPASFTIFRITGESNPDPNLQAFDGAVVDRVVRVSSELVGS
jgi:branched-chain amino acid transport system substrate-binding protein